MIPYASFLYFGVLLYVAVPTAVTGLAGRLRLTRAWILLATGIMLAVQYAADQPLWRGVAVRGLWLVLGFAVLEYGVARAFLTLRARARAASNARPAFYAALAASLAPLAVAKFVPLLAPGDQIGFLGISYVTFRCLDVIFNIQDGLIVPRPKAGARPEPGGRAEFGLPPARYLAYLLFFPTISSGPIDRYRRFGRDWDQQRTRADFLADLDSAAQHIFRGLLYKFILAALIKRYALDPLATGNSLATIVGYMYAYTFYLFFDFAGYSAFAVGISSLLGVHTPENFNLPFLARNIRDFWDRWHISLSWWFRDHIYMRFVMSATRGKWFPNRYVASYLGFFLSMGLMGLWHGTAWHYILYGLYHGTLLSVNDWFSRWNRTRGLFGSGRGWQIVSIVVTFQAVCLGLLLFSGRLG